MESSKTTLDSLLKLLIDLVGQELKPTKFDYKTGDLPDGFERNDERKLGQKLVAELTSSQGRELTSTSISHSDGIVAAVSVLSGNYSIGVDFERADRLLSQALIQRVFSENEQNSAKDLGFSFVMLWCAKEAAYKARRLTDQPITAVALENIRKLNSTTMAAVCGGSCRVWVQIEKEYVAALAVKESATDPQIPS